MINEIDDQGFVEELVGAFIEECEDGLAECRRALESKDFDAVRCAAHGLKGSAAIFGAQVLSETAKKLEYAINVRAFAIYHHMEETHSHTHTRADAETIMMMSSRTHTTQHTFFARACWECGRVTDVPLL